LKRRFDDPALREEVRRNLAGLGERSSHKSYYPALQDRLAELQRFRTLLDGGSEAIFLAGLPDGALLDVNDSACRQLRRAREALVGVDLSTVVAPAERGRLADALGRVHPGGPAETLVLRMARGDGSVFPAELSVAAKQLEGRTFAVAVARDVTEREQLQARLAAADRMVALGTLAAGVSHEIGNPLSYAMLSLDHMKLELARLRAGLAGAPADVAALLEALGGAEEALADAVDGAGRVRDIAANLKAFSRVEATERRVLDVRKVVDQALTVSGHVVRQRARVVREYAEVPGVSASGPRLAQVFVNLLVNAAQAMPEGPADANEIRLSTRASEGWVEVAVADTGAGIAPEHLDRIFQPFFTTKPEGVGTGLGLPICRDIVQALGGSIAVESAPGRGTVFTVRLPGAPGPVEPPR